MSRFLNRVWLYLRHVDYLLFALVAAVSVYSLVLLKSVSRATTANYFTTQLFAIALGFVGAWFLTLIDYHTLGNFWYLVAGFSIFLMLYTMVFGISIVNEGGVNAKAWISIGGKTFQSSELVKIAFMLTFSKHLDVLCSRGMQDRFSMVLLLFVHALIPMGLCHLQGDDGAAVIFFFMFLCMSWAAGIRKRYFLWLFLAAVVAIPILWQFVLSDYQKARFTAVYNLDDPVVSRGDGYQQYQARISIGSGQFGGRGLFQGPRVENNSVTFQQSDFIFSVAGEELGFVGCLLILALLFFLMVRVLHTSLKSKDILGRCICAGFFGLIASQTVFNIGMCLALLPVMGVTLPFFSGGGSSAMCLYLGYGLVQNVFRHHKYVSGLNLRRL